MGTARCALEGNELQALLAETFSQHCLAETFSQHCLAETFSQHCLECISLNLQGNEVQVVEVRLHSRCGLPPWIWAREGTQGHVHESMAMCMRA